MQSWFQFELDGKSYRVEQDDTHLTLAEFLLRLDEIFADFSFGDSRRGGCPVILGLLEGDCPRFRLVDATLLWMPQLADRQVWTPQGIENSDPNHPVNEALREGIFESGTKRGGALAVTFFEGYYRPDLRRIGQIYEQFDGLVTRSLNVPAVRRAASQIYASVEQSRHDAAKKAQRSGTDNEIWTGREDIHKDVFSRRLQKLEGGQDLQFVDGAKRRFYRPGSLVELLRLRAEYPEAQLIAGGTGMVEGGERSSWQSLLSIEGVDELSHCRSEQDFWEVGAAVSLTRVGELIGRECPAFSKILRRFASRAVRNRATLGGYLATAWSHGQLSPLLMALDARVMLLSSEGERDAPMSQFFDKKGGTILQEGELIRSVIIPRATESLLESRGMTNRICDAYTVGPRRNLANPFLNAAFAIELRESRVAKAWLAFSGIARVPLRIREAEEALAGKAWNEDTMHSVLPILNRQSRALLEEKEASQKTVRANSDYCQQLAITLFQKFFYQHPDANSVSPRHLSAARELARMEKPFFDVDSA